MLEAGGDSITFGNGSAAPNNATNYNLVKFGLGEPIGGRPLLLFGFFSVIAGAQFVSTGVLAETLARIYFESGAADLYQVRHPEVVGDGDDWRAPVKS